MRSLFSITFVTAVLLPAAAGGELTGTVTLGGRTVADEGNPARAAEYRPTTSGPEVLLALTAAFDSTYLAVASTASDGHDQIHELTLDLGRTVRSHTTFTRLLHRLEHDPLDNLRGTVKEVVATWSTDLDPFARYRIDYDTLTNRTDLQLPAAGWLTVSAHYREQWRKGHKQSLAMSHCSSCHVQSQGRGVNENTRDAGLSARAELGRWDLDGSFMARDFRERASTPTRIYERAEHPSQRLPLWNDRVWYDIRDGAIPYDVVPASDKTTLRLTLSNRDLGGFSVSFSGVKSNVENLETGNEVTYEAIALAMARRLGRQASFSLRARSYSIDSTDYFVDVPEPLAVAGPYAGKSYFQRYGFQPDFLRQSAIDRDVQEARARLVYRLAKQASLTGEYTVKQIDRANYEVAPGQTSTLDQRFKLTLATRPSNAVNLRLAGTWAEIRRPFMIIDAACLLGPLQEEAKPSPLAPGSTQYYQIHQARIADLTASPSSFYELQGSAGFTLGPSASASVTARLWDGKNNDQDLTDWSRSTAAVTANLAWALSPASQAFIATTYGRRKMATHVCIPLMDG